MEGKSLPQVTKTITTTPISSIRLVPLNSSTIVGQLLLALAHKICLLTRTRSTSTISLATEALTKLSSPKRTLSITLKRSTTPFLGWMRAPANKLISKMCLFTGVVNTQARKRHSVHAENSTKSSHLSLEPSKLDPALHPSSWTLCSVVSTKSKPQSRTVPYPPSTKYTRISLTNSIKAIK